jgi:asparagine synthase (glutamine-hydrolysing)
MCGILGFASYTHSIDKDKLAKNINLLSHRGPDDSGIWESSDGKVGFAHNRLSIIDLSSNGHQPMMDVSGRLTIIFNGEIYNYQKLFKTLSIDYKFNSKTDTEVILAAYTKWGVECVSHLDGMFAFAIYDSTQKSIFISRDRAGEKPLFYRYNENTLTFASELKSLLDFESSEAIISRESLDCYLGMGFVPKDRCILKGFNKLPAAHSLLFDLQSNKLKVWRYWSVSKIAQSLSANKSSKKDLVSELEVLLEDSICRQMIADVPVGVLLSGGVDSSLITAIAARNTEQLKTFTVRFPNSGKLDETKHARLIAKKFNTEHVELDASSVEPDLLVKLARQFDEPIVDSSMIPTFLVSQLVQKHCKVVLGGDGADELFGGYEHYSRLLTMEKYARFVPKLVRSRISSFAEKNIPIGTKARSWLLGFDYDTKNGVPLIANYFDPTARNSLMHGKFNHWDAISESILQANTSKQGDLIQRATMMDFNNYLVEDILVKVDRSSMLASLEVRAPFLDRRIIEFAFGEVPSFLKVTSNNKKILLKKLASRILPSEFDRQRKQGFSVPINEWLKEGNFRDFFYDVLLDSQSVFDKKSTIDLLKGQDKGRNNGERLFALVMFELWRREYKISI